MSREIKTVFIKSPKSGVDGGPIKFNSKDEKDYLATPHTFIGNLERPHTVLGKAQKLGNPRHSISVQ